MFHYKYYKPTFLGYPHGRKPPYGQTSTLWSPSFFAHVISNATRRQVDHPCNRTGRSSKEETEGRILMDYIESLPKPSKYLEQWGNINYALLWDFYILLHTFTLCIYIYIILYLEHPQARIWAWTCSDLFFCVTFEISPASKFSPGNAFCNYAQDGISSLNGQSRLNWCSG
jgi:hypothetical protein